MKKHNQDAKDYFDEYGNFRPPELTRQENAQHRRWVIKGFYPSVRGNPIVYVKF